MPGLIIDTFNVLHTTGVLPPELAGLDVMGLAGLILRSRHASERVTFACDGLPASDLPAPGALVIDGHPEAAMDVQFSGRQATADDLIMRMIDVSTAPRRLTVISSDHAIQKHARRRRCVTLSSEEFLQQLADDAHLQRQPGAIPRRPTWMTSDQVEQWKRTFDVDEQAIENAVAPPQTPSPLPPPPGEPTPGPQEPATPSPLPSELIDEAERMWQRDVKSPRSEATPDDRAKDAANASQGLRFVGEHDEVDMSRILPDDGRTFPLRKREDRQRPPAPPDAAKP